MATNRALSAAAQLDDYWLKLRMENDQLPIQHLAITDPARNLIVNPSVVDLGPKLSEALKIYIRLKGHNRPKTLRHLGNGKRWALTIKAKSSAETSALLILLAAF